MPLWNALAAVVGARPRCSDCRRLVRAVLDRFADEFRLAASSHMLTPQDKQRLWKPVLEAGIAREEALPHIQGVARQIIERALSQASSDGDIGEGEEQAVRDLARSVAMPHATVAQMEARLESIKLLGRVREGILPSVECNLHLESGEVCHLNVPAIYHKHTRGKTELVHGNLVATSQRIRFLSAHGGWAIGYKNVMRVSKGMASINLKLSTQRGNGTYNVSNPVLCQAMLSTLTKMAKRQMLAPPGEARSRHIPQQVKNAVWHRDGGKCVECGDSHYLEFDHIIPHSKGGASSLNNVQLLCRKCNGAKSDRI